MTIAIELSSELYPGRVALVDDADLALVEKHAWSAHHTGYAQTQINGKFTLMHRLILPDIPRIDHVNGVRVDNRRSNLRPATASQNAMNRSKSPGTSSRFKGVVWKSQPGKWMAYIYVDGKQRYLGYFTDETDAATAYDRAAVEVFGEFAKTNAQLAHAH